MPNIYFGINSIELAIQKLADLMVVEDEPKAFGVWSDFVVYLNHSWIKTERGCQDIRSKFEPYQGKYKKLRKEDPMLSYLKNARDYQEHYSGPLIKLVPISKSFLLNQHVIIREVDHSDDTAPAIETVAPLYPADFVLSDFETRSGMWTVPSSHNGALLKHIGSPYEIGYLACTFYLIFLLDLDSRFLERFNEKKLVELLYCDTLMKAQLYEGKTHRFDTTRLHKLDRSKTLYMEWRDGPPPFQE